MSSLAPQIALVLLLSTVAYGEVSQAVCLSDRVGLNAHSRTTFDTEIREILKPIGVTFHEICTEGAVRVVLSHHPPTRYAGALGLAYRHGDRILAGLHVYLQPVVKLLGERASAGVVGRALARVAAHEVGHYVFQQTDHHHHGLMREAFPLAQLASDDFTYFLQAKR